jgi:hypothetical protein
MRRVDWLDGAWAENAHTRCNAPQTIATPHDPPRRHYCIVVRKLASNDRQPGNYDSAQITLSHTYLSHAMNT